MTHEQLLDLNRFLPAFLEGLEALIGGTWLFDRSLIRRLIRGPPIARLQ